MIEFPFGEQGRVLLPIYIKPYHDTTMLLLDFKVDTGADFTTISKSDLRELGYSRSWIDRNIFEDGSATTASGEYIAIGFICLPFINILGYEARNWPFRVMTDESRDFRNLLGRDLLSGFNYTFNNDDDIFQITRAREFKRRFKFLDGQEIHVIHKSGT